MAAVYSKIWALLTSRVMMLTIGGALGTNARYWLGVLLNEAAWRKHSLWLSTFPVATFAINVSGSFVLGLVGTIFLERLPDHRDWFLLLGIGFCGGYTTFSTFEWETLQLLRAGSWMMAAANVVGSVVVGFIGVWLGAAAGNLILPRQ